MIVLLLDYHSISNVLALNSAEQSWRGIGYRRASIAVQNDFQSFDDNDDDDDDDDIISLDHVIPITVGKQHSMDINSTGQKEIVESPTATVSKPNDEIPAVDDEKEEIVVEVIECASSYSSQFGIETIVCYQLIFALIYNFLFMYRMITMIVF